MSKISIYLCAIIGFSRATNPALIDHHFAFLVCLLSVRESGQFMPIIRVISTRSFFIISLFMQLRISMNLSFVMAGGKRT